MKFPLQATFAIFVLAFIAAEATQSNVEKICSISLNVSNAGIQRINSHFINSKNVQELILSNNEISEISEGAFSHMEHLEKLDISYNKLSAEQFFSSVSMSSLKSLSLDYNYNYNHNRYTRSSSSVLRINNTFSSLESLSLKSCNISKVSTNWSVSFPKISILDLSENSLQIEDIGSHVSRTLEILNLRKTNMTRFCTKSLGNLKSLFLDGNNFEAIDSISGCSSGLLNLRFEDESRLESLSIANCSVGVIGENAFQNMQNLRVLNLARNKFEVLRRETLVQLKSIQELNLSETSLRVIPDFSVIGTLQKLSMNNMRYSGIFQSTSSSVWNLRHLQTLSLAYNNIQTLQTSIFSHLTSLINLDVSFNQITSLDISWNAAALRSIFLTGNLIKKMNALNLRGAVNLVELDLKQTKIDSFSVGDLRYIPENVTIHYVPYCP